MVKGENNHIAVELTDEPGVAKIIDESNEQKLLFFEHDYVPYVFIVDDQRIAFISQERILGFLT